MRIVRARLSASCPTPISSVITARPTFSSEVSRRSPASLFWEPSPRTFSLTRPHGSRDTDSLHEPLLNHSIHASMHPGAPARVRGFHLFVVLLRRRAGEERQSWTGLQAAARNDRAFRCVLTVPR